MPETLLSFSEVLLFGRVVDDVVILGANQAESLTAVAATTVDLPNRRGLGPVDGVNLAVGNKVLVVKQTAKSENGLYTVSDSANKDWLQQKLPKGTLVTVTGGATQSGVWKEKLPIQSGNQEFEKINGTAPGRGLGRNKHLAEQITNDAQLARIYGFAFEGAFYELPAPTMFIVHGDGESPTRWTNPGGLGPAARADNAPGGLASRAPNEPSLSGVAAADFQIADDIRVWAYDKADYSIRMDVSTGQFEQILLDIFFEVEAPMIAGGRVAGGRVAGGRVAGGRVAGGRVAGGRVAGGRVSGGRVGGSSD